MYKLSCDIRCIVVRFYCLNEDVEYGLNFKLLRDETIKVIYFFGTNIGVKSLLANQSILASGCSSKLRSILQKLQDGRGEKAEASN